MCGDQVIIIVITPTLQAVYDFPDFLSFFKVWCGTKLNLVVRCVSIKISNGTLSLTL
jgi:hypothetical protein